MMKNKIKVLPVAGRMLMDIDVLNAGIKRFVGYDEGKIINKPIEVENNIYYRRAIQNGDLELYVEPAKNEKQNKIV